MNESYQIDSVVAACFEVKAFRSILLVSHVVTMDSVYPGINICERGVHYLVLLVADCDVIPIPFWLQDEQLSRLGERDVLICIPIGDA